MNPFGKKTLSEEWPVFLHDKAIINIDDASSSSDDHLQEVAFDETGDGSSEESSEESMTISQQLRTMDCIVPLDDCFDCRIQLSRRPVDQILEHCDEDAMDSSNMNADDEGSMDERDDSAWNWDEYFGLLTAVYASCHQEQEDFHLAFYDETDFDPALFLNANIP